MDLNYFARNLQPHYSRFDVANRLLFSGHSHQAWPDVAREGLTECFDAAAQWVDGKWEKAFQKVDILRNYLRDWYQDPNGQYTPAASTHDVLIKWFSALDLQKGDEIITTSGEFYSIFRQAKALKETGIQVNSIDTAEYESISERICDAIKPKTKAVLVSRVFFESGLQLVGLETIAKRCINLGVPLLIDDYHGTNVLKTKIGGTDFEKAYWLIGGYKYLQWGEGNCFIRYPQNCTLKPKLTGWFASFSTLQLPKSEYVISYDKEMKFAGGTFDPASAYRAAKVVQFFKEQELTKDYLVGMYRQRGSEFRETFKKLNLNKEIICLASDESENNRAGFVALKSKFATDLQNELVKNGVYTDARGFVLRFGFAPYITSEQIEQALIKLKECVVNK